MKVASDTTGFPGLPSLHNRERTSHPEIAVDEIAVDGVPRRHVGAAPRWDIQKPDVTRCSLIAAAACGASVVTLAALDARMAPLKMLLAHGMASHCGSAAAYLGSVHWWQSGGHRSMLDIASGAAGASLAGLGVNLLSNPTGEARMLTLKAAGASSLIIFSCFMLPTQIKTDGRGGGPFSVVCWGSIVILCILSQCLEEAGVAASSQKALGNVPFISASENALSMYLTATAGMALWGAVLGYIGVHADRRMACMAGAVIGGLSFIPAAVAMIATQRA